MGSRERSSTAAASREGGAHRTRIATPAALDVRAAWTRVRREKYLTLHPLVRRPRDRKLYYFPSPPRRSSSHALCPWFVAGLGFVLFVARCFHSRRPSRHDLRHDARGLTFCFRLFLPPSSYRQQHFTSIRELIYRSSCRHATFAFLYQGCSGQADPSVLAQGQQGPSLLHRIGRISRNNPPSSIHFSSRVPAQ